MIEPVKLRFFPTHATDAQQPLSKVKHIKMKLPKTLLTAIVLGISLQALPSCEKEKVEPRTEKEKKEKEKEECPPPDNCPGCGLG